MAEEGKNKVASSLLDLQPTAILELFRIYPDRINRPTLFLGFHGGSIFNESLNWQGVQYLPLAIESEGFNILADGTLPRPKIRIANRNFIITNLLQNFKDLINAKVIRKRVSVKYLDDSNFEGGNPFGVADPKAELANETWLMGRKVLEDKIFVEFELNSPLDLESFSVNSRGITAKFCYWQYRGEGCRYMGHPIERDDGRAFLDASGKSVTPNEWSVQAPEGSPVDFMLDPTAEWSATQDYAKGNIVLLTSPSTVIPPLDQELKANESGVPLTTAFVAVKGLPDDSNLGQSPESNPSYWQKDGCTKKLSACKKRFNNLANASFIDDASAATQEFPAIKISGASVDGYPSFTGLFHSDAQQLTGTLTGAFTLMGWANMNALSPYGAGLFSTTPRDDDAWPNAKFFNINADVEMPSTEDSGAFDPGSSTNSIGAEYVGYKMGPDLEDSSHRHVPLGYQQPISEEEGRNWVQYIVTNDTGTLRGEDLAQQDQTTIIKFYANHDQPRNATLEGLSEEERQRVSQNAEDNLGNFASVTDRIALADETIDGKPALPQTFMLGAVEHYWGTGGWEGANPKHYTTSMNGALATWALWNRVLNSDELAYLRKEIHAPTEVVNAIGQFAPRLYSECTGQYTTLTGGTGEGAAEGTLPLLYASGSLVAWWDGTTGLVPSTTATGMLDIHTGGFHLTGSGEFAGIAEGYWEGDMITIPNPHGGKLPRFGGFPGTDGFSYGRDTKY
jgi:lambda family phage minor tail protein L